MAPRKHNDSLRGKMADFDYTVSAELFSGRVGQGRHKPVTYRRFSDAAAAIQFAMEHLDPVLLKSACLEVDEMRYTGEEIERFYASIEYPLVRQIRSAVGEIERSGEGGQNETAAR